MSKHSRISKQLWELSLIGMMGLGMAGLQDDGKRFLSGDLLLDMEAESLDYQDHREIFTGPAAMAAIADQMEDWDELSGGPVTAHIDSADDLREGLGWSPLASFDRDVPSYSLWDESWETAESFDSSLA